MLPSRVVASAGSRSRHRSTVRPIVFARSAQPRAPLRATRIPGRMTRPESRGVGRYVNRQFPNATGGVRSSSCRGHGRPPHPTNARGFRRDAPASRNTVVACVVFPRSPWPFRMDRALAGSARGQSPTTRRCRRCGSGSARFARRRVRAARLPGSGGDFRRANRRRPRSTTGFSCRRFIRFPPGELPRATPWFLRRSAPGSAPPISVRTRTCRALPS